MKRHRPAIPVMARLHAALFQLGFEPHEVECDHDPALELRAYNPETREYSPSANDPRYLVFRPKAEHAAKTTGRKGESRKCDQSNGDTPRAAKLRRIEREHQEFQRRLLSKGEAQETTRQKRKIPSRPFQKRVKA